jgi:class 3 adenylate cyclase
MTGIVAAHRGNVVNRMGDGILATFDGSARAVHCVASLRDTAASLGTTVRSAWVAYLLGMAFGQRALIAPGDERHFGDAADGGS